MQGEGGWHALFSLSATQTIILYLMHAACLSSLSLLKLSIAQITNRFIIHLKSNEKLHSASAIVHTGDMRMVEFERFQAYNLQMRTKTAGGSSNHVGLSENDLFVLNLHF